MTRRQEKSKAPEPIEQDRSLMELREQNTPENKAAFLARMAKINEEAEKKKAAEAAEAAPKKIPLPGVKPEKPRQSRNIAPAAPVQSKKRHFPFGQKPALKKAGDNQAAQLDLFSFIGHEGGGSSLSAVYDRLPLRHYTNQVSDELQTVVRHTVVDGVRFRLKLKSVGVERKVSSEKGATKEELFYLPGVRERIVEDIIRMFAHDPKKLIIEDSATRIRFSLYELYSECKRTGHTYSAEELREAIYVLKNYAPEIFCVGEDGKESVINSGIIESYMAKTETKWRGKGEKDVYFVKLHEFIMQEIRTLTVRPYDYERCIRYKSELSAFLLKHLFTTFRNAEKNLAFEIDVDLVFSQIGFTRMRNIGLEKDMVCKALKYLVEDGVIEPEFEAIKKYKKLSTDKKKKWFVRVYPTQEFASAIHRNNCLMMEAREILKEKQGVTPIA